MSHKLINFCPISPTLYMATLYKGYLGLLEIALATLSLAMCTDLTIYLQFLSNLRLLFNNETSNHRRMVGRAPNSLLTCIAMCSHIYSFGSTYTVLRNFHLRCNCKASFRRSLNAGGTCRAPRSLVLRSLPSLLLLRARRTLCGRMYSFDGVLIYRF